MIATQSDTRDGGRLHGEGNLIGQSDRVHQRPDGMEPVGAPFKHPENQIHFSRSQNPKTGRIHSQRTGAALIPASFDLIFFETVPERPGIQSQEARGALLDPLAPFERFQQQVFLDGIDEPLKIQTVLR